MEKEKVVLAFSGGLDTSYCVKYLSEECGYDVYTAIANTGGFSAEDLKRIEERALALGAVKHATLDITQEYYEKSIKYMIMGNVLRNGTYPISVSSERNMNLTREYEINYLKRHGYEADFKKLEYSINKGLWGTSIGGKETLHSDQTLPEEAYPTQMTATADMRLTLSFEKGEISAINGKKYADKVAAIQDLEQIAGQYAIGRDMHIGDTIIGIKGRVGFEAAAPMLIIAAHKMLEKHTLTKWQQYWKDQLGTWYGMFLHEAQYLEPVMRNIEAFLLSSQENVTGDVIIDLKPYRYVLVGVNSDFDLMKTDFGEYGEISKGWTAEDVKGFTKILGNQIKIYYNNQVKNGKIK